MIQQFEFQEKEISGVFLITPFSVGDERGGMTKDYSQEMFQKQGIDFTPLETMYITSCENVLRGLHFQRIKPQAKLIRCIHGNVWAAVVDLRRQSVTFGKWFSVTLDQTSGMELLVPKGCAVGTLALSDSMFSCQCDEKYYPEYDGGIRWDDPDIAVKWPLDALQGNAVISQKDESLPGFQSYLEYHRRDKK